MKFDIIEETVVKNKLVIRCKIDLKEYADEDTVIVKTKDVIEKLSERYNITSENFHLLAYISFCLILLSFILKFTYLKQII